MTEELLGHAQVLRVIVDSSSEGGSQVMARYAALQSSLSTQSGDTGSCSPILQGDDWIARSIEALGEAVAQVRPCVARQGNDSLLVTLASDSEGHVVQVEVLGANTERLANAASHHATEGNEGFLLGATCAADHTLYTCRTLGNRVRYTLGWDWSDVILEGFTDSRPSSERTQASQASARRLRTHFLAGPI